MTDNLTILLPPEGVQLPPEAGPGISWADPIVFGFLTVAIGLAIIIWGIVKWRKHVTKQ